MKLEKAESRDWKVAHLKSGYSVDVYGTSPLTNINYMIDDIINIYNEKSVCRVRGAPVSTFQQLKRSNRVQMYDYLSVHLFDLLAYASDQNMVPVATARIKRAIQLGVAGRATGKLIIQIWNFLKKERTQCSKKPLN